MASRMAYLIDDALDIAKKNQGGVRNPIPEIPRQLLLDRVRKIKPLLRVEGRKELSVIGPMDEFRASILEGEILWPAPRLEYVGQCRMYSEAKGGNFSPTMKEILSQLPDKHALDISYFKMVLEDVDDPVGGYFSVWVIFYK